MGSGSELGSGSDLGSSSELGSGSDLGSGSELGSGSDFGPDMGSDMVLVLSTVLNSATGSPVQESIDRRASYLLLIVYRPPPCA